METEETSKKKISKKKIIILVAGIALLLIAAGCIFFFMMRGRQEEQKNPDFMMADMGEGVISASGLTSVAMQDETYELDFLETALYVEESYLSVGDEVQEGTKVFKVSEATLEKAARELEKAVMEAGLAYRQGKIDCETGKLEAEGTLKSAEVNKKYAKAEYDSSVSEAGKQVEELAKQVDEARELFEEYSSSVNSNYYYTYYKVEELQQTYYDDFSYLMKMYEEWDIADLESTSDNLNMNTASQLSGMQGNQGSNGQNTGNTGTDKLSVYNLLDELVQEEGAAYEEALKQYKDASAKAQAALDQANSKLLELQAQLEQARTVYQQELITCKADYDTTLAESENAQLVYDTAIEKLEETFAALEDTKQEAEENQALFEDTIGDGYFRTGSAGTIVMAGVRKGSYLSGESLLIAYSNPETVTVSASVGQESIASIAVGDSAYVVIDGYGSFTGTVLSVNPVTQSQSKSSVTYQVTVDLEGDISGLESNLTAYVYFGMSEEMINKMQSRGSQGMPAGEDGTPAGGEGMPAGEGETFIREGEMPAGGEGMPAGEGGMLIREGEMPDGMPADGKVMRGGMSQ